jgi:hypothetical protein
VQPHYVGIGFKIPRFRLIDDGLQKTKYPTQTLLDRFHTVAAIRRAWWIISDSEWRLNGAILDNFIVLAEKHGMGCGVAFLPGRSDTPDDQERRNWLKEFANGRKTPFIDLTEPIHAHGENAFIPANWHLSPLGHKVVADELQQFISNEVLIQQSEKQ